MCRWGLVFHGPILRGKPVANFGRLVVERSHPSAISDVTRFINDVQPLRPGRIRVVRCIAHVIDAEGQREFEARREIFGDGHALLQRFRLCVTNVVLHVGLHLPFVSGMRLADIYGKKIRMVLVVVVDLNDVAYLAAEGRSSEAAEHQHQRACANAFANMKMTRTVER